VIPSYHCSPFQSTIKNKICNCYFQFLHSWFALYEAFLELKISIQDTRCGRKERPHISLSDLNTKHGEGGAGKAPASTPRRMIGEVVL
jgi:hypothetical protein